jgi:hypothetical protein
VPETHPLALRVPLYIIIITAWLSCEYCSIGTGWQAGVDEHVSRFNNRLDDAAKNKLTDAQRFDIAFHMLRESA